MATTVDLDASNKTSFVSLPIEIHRHIASFLTFPDVWYLKKADRMMYARIDASFKPKNKLELFKAEAKVRRSKDCWACYECMQFLPKRSFIDYERGDTGLSGKAITRCCIACGLFKEANDNDNWSYKHLRPPYSRPGCWRMFSKPHYYCAGCNTLVPPCDVPGAGTDGPRELHCEKCRTVLHRSEEDQETWNKREETRDRSRQYVLRHAAEMEIEKYEPRQPPVIRDLDGDGDE